MNRDYTNSYAIFGETLDKAWSKKIIDKLYDKELDATSFDRILHMIKEYFMKNEYWKAVKAIEDSTIDQIIDEQVARNERSETCYSESTMWTFSDVGEFKELKEGDKVDIQILRTGKWNHPMYGEVVITGKTIDDVVTNFNNNERGIDIAVDENHDPMHKALGWYRELKKQGSDVLNASIELTKQGAELMNQGAYKYFSPEISFNKKDEESGKIMKNLLIGGAFTNRPFFKGMKSLMASEGDVANQFTDNVLLFNTNSSMKTILDLLGKFAEMTTLSKEDKASLSAKFSELPEEDKTPELKDAVNEATKEETIIETPVVESVTVSASEESVTIQASEYASLKGLVSQVAELTKEKRKNLIEAKIGAFAFSETNKSGIAPKMVEEISSFALSLSEEMSDKFLSIVGKIQTISMGEIGHDSATNSPNREHVNFFMEKLNMSEADAILAANEAKKDL